MATPDSILTNVASRAADESLTDVSLMVNGEEVRARVPDRLLLSDFLRDILGLTALKVCCGEGACGACTVIVDGETARTCTLLAVQVDGSRILTLEGLNIPEKLNRVQHLFQQYHALQCGYCTPGLLMTVHCMVERGVAPDSAQVPQYLSGHLCRCTGYRNVLTAVHKALLGETTAEKQQDQAEEHV